MQNVQSPRTDDAGIEQELAAKAVAPRVTPADIEANIASEHYFTGLNAVNRDSSWDPAMSDAQMQKSAEALSLLTFCVLVLRNGFTVTGKSAPASPENFDAEMGRRIARSDAINQCWPLMGYALKEQLWRASLPKVVDVENIARACHEVNRAYCTALGDLSQPAWADAPDWQKDSARAGVRMHLANPNAGPEASQASWMAQKEAEGWTYGPEKRPDLKQHHCMVPFEKLPREQQDKDWIFRAVVHSMAGLA